jgi:hypothetical protein
LSGTMWFARCLVGVCLLGLVPAIAIKLAAPSTSVVVAPAQHQSRTEPAFALNEAAKSDRLALPNARAEPGIVVPGAITAPAAKPSPAETPSTAPVAVNKAADPPSQNNPSSQQDASWQNANASIVPIAPLRRHVESRKPKPIAVRSLPNQRTEVWHCRQDATGDFLRALDLSPKCQ